VQHFTHFVSGRPGIGLPEGKQVHEYKVKTTHSVRHESTSSDDDARDAMGEDNRYYGYFGDDAFAYAADDDDAYDYDEGGYYYDAMEYEESAFMLYKKFIDSMNHLYYSNDDNWDEIKFTTNDDVQKCNNKLHRSVQVCFCENDVVKQPFECNEDGAQQSAAHKFPFMNTLQMNGKQGTMTSGLDIGSGNSLATLAKLDPSALQGMQDYSFTEASSPMESSGAHPMTVNVHFEYPRNYRETVENGAFGAAQEMEEDNLLMAEDGEYSYYAYGGDDYYDYDRIYDHNEGGTEMEYDYYSAHYGEEEEEGESAMTGVNGWDEQSDSDIAAYEGSAAYINIEYDNNVVDEDMRISIEKGSNEYVPYLNPDVTGFGQRVRISWNTFWKLQLMAILCGVTLFMAIALYFYSPLKNLQFTSSVMMMNGTMDPSYGHAKSIDHMHCDESLNAADYQYDRPQLDEVEQLNQ